MMVICVLQNCVDWTIQPNTDCPGNDMSETWNLNDGGTDAPEGPPKCIDLCLANRPGCVGWSWQIQHFQDPMDVSSNTKWKIAEITMG